MESNGQSRKLPDKIKVLGIDYRIDVADLKEDDCDGEYDYDKCVIRVDDNHQDDDTVSHELLHIIDYAFKLNLREQQIHLLARGLFAVARDNEWYVKHLAGDLK